MKTVVGAQAAASEQRRWYSVDEVADIYRVDPMTIRRAIKAGEMPALRIRTRLIIPAKALAAIEEAVVAASGVVDSSDLVAIAGLVTAQTVSK